VINNGIDLDTFYNAKSKSIVGIPNDSIKIIMIGRFNPTKDQPTAIKAMSLLPDNYHLILVGDGSLKNDCIRLSEKIKVSERVHFLGKRSDIAELLKSCDLNLISSHSEGLSISSLEALASGKPLICSDVPGLREINTNIGLLFEDNNFKELAKQILRIINDNELYNKVVENSLKKVASYSIKQTAEQHINLYHKILNK
ncbi:MAG: glycosyl transferase, partial [Muricauda sp.]|nr:glycosyl transferase [Allomuricauda sp.]